jgi:hypothetical protein
MNSTGGWGSGAVSFAIGQGLGVLIVVLVVVFALWRLAKILWRAFS